MHFFLQDYEKSLEWQDSSYKAAMYQDYFPDQSQRYSACFHYDGQQILMTEQTYLLNHGIAGFLLANGALNADGAEYELRKELLEKDKVEVIVVLPFSAFKISLISS